MAQISLPQFDTYTRKARFEAGLIIALPIGLAAIAWFPEGIPGWSAFSAVVITFGGATLMTQLARDRGKQKEPALWRSWGGPPTTQCFRYRGNSNKTLTHSRHKKLKKLRPDLRAPTEEDDVADPQRCDEVYETWTRFLIEKTRDEKAFPLIFKENCNYGFRRNLWGLKPLGIVTCLVGLLLVGLLLYQNYRRGISPKPVTLLSGCVDLLLILVWLFWIAPSWIRIAADAYAERLLAAIDKL